MPISYRIDRERRVVFVRGEGEVTIEDLKGYSAGVVNDPAYEAGMDELVDFRGAAGAEKLTTEQILEVRALNRELSDAVGASKLAFVVDSDLAFGLARIFMAYSEDSKITHEVFRDLAEARAWLGLDPGAEEA